VFDKIIVLLPYWSCCVVRKDVRKWESEIFSPMHVLNSRNRIFLQIKSTWCTVFLSMFISFFYMFRGTMFPSSGETTIFMRHLVLVILCGWRYGMQGGSLCDTWYLLFCVDDCLASRVEVYATLGTCSSVWMTVWHPGWKFMWHLVLVLLCGWLFGTQGGRSCDTWYLSFCVDDCLVRRVEVHVTLGTCYSVWMSFWYAGWKFTWHLILVILCGWVSGTQGGNLCDTWCLLFCVDECLVGRVEVYVTLGTCYCVWMTVWYARWKFMWHLVLVILCGWLVRRVEVYVTLGACYSLWMTVWYSGCKFMW
jgi:hypothetical protein